MLPMEDWIAGLVTMFVVAICVLVHFEGLKLLSDRVPHNRFRHRNRIIILILAVLFLHVLEVWIFGLAYYVLLGLDGYGELVGTTAPNLIDCVYYSATVFSTLGFGDIYPVGALRVVTGTEAVAGLTLIGWSASYTFVEMLKTWSPDE